MGFFEFRSRMISAELDRLAKFRRLERELEEARAEGRRRGDHYPTSGDPDIIGEHEVRPVLCPCCRVPLPWALIKGWRD